MKNQAMEKVLKAQKRKKELKEQKAEALMSQAFSFPEIHKAHSDYMNAVFSQCASDNEDNRKKVKNTYKLYCQKLLENGFSEKDFSYSAECKICNDTGVVGGKVCKCVWKNYIKQLEEDCNILKTAPFTFESCNFKEINNQKQKEELEQLYSSMKNYVSKYPKIKINTVTFVGETGTGKSSLASAMARKMVARGYSAQFMSAYSFNSLMLKTHTSPISERNNFLQNILTCDILVIDDLGTEPILRNVTNEYLLLTLEERLIKGLSTVITTNLNYDGLLKRYGERIYSRLSDKKHSLILEINGNDLRR